MCFDQKTSFAFAALGFYLAYYVKTKTSNTKLAAGVFWFFLMELLQGFQYIWIDQCSNPMNRILTLVGFVHICYQPYFTHIINSSLTKNPKFLDQYQIVLRLCLLGGSMLLARHFLAEFSTTSISSDFGTWAGLTPAANSSVTTEWLRGEQLCTYKGKYHLAWSVPMYDVSYFSPSAAIHSFLMFAPFFVMKRNMVVQGVFLWALGPYLASWITPNLQEQASIWCFFSIAQIAVMLFLIREQLLLSWGSSKKTSMHVQHGSAATDSPAPVKKAKAEKATPKKAEKAEKAATPAKKGASPRKTTPRKSQ